MDQIGAARRLPTSHISLLTKVARLYHEQGLRQPEIAVRLHLSQSRVSRLLKEAVTLGVVRTVVVPPPGLHGELEDSVRDRYGLQDVVVAESSAPDESAVNNAIGAAGAVYLETTLASSDRVGISSWSATLLSVVDSMAPRTVREVAEIVQVIGGVGNTSVQVKATHLAEQLARVTGATPTFFPAPGIVSTTSGRDALLAEDYVDALVAAWKSLSVLLIGIGSLQPSELLKTSGNAVSAADQEVLRELGAVGDVCLRFFDAAGALVPTALHDRVLGIDADTLLSIPRRVGFAGGQRKHQAIKAALLGGWVNVLITDVDTATYLMIEDPVSGR